VVAIQRGLAWRALAVGRPPSRERGRVLDPSLKSKMAALMYFRSRTLPLSLLSRPASRVVLTVPNQTGIPLSEISMVSQGKWGHRLANWNIDRPMLADIRQSNSSDCVMYQTSNFTSTTCQISKLCSSVASHSMPYIERDVLLKSMITREEFRKSIYTAPLQRLLKMIGSRYIVTSGTYAHQICVHEKRHFQPRDTNQGLS